MSALFAAVERRDLALLRLLLDAGATSDETPSITLANNPTPRCWTRCTGRDSRIWSTTSSTSKTSPGCAGSSTTV